MNDWPLEIKVFLTGCTACRGEWGMGEWGMGYKLKSFRSPLSHKGLFPKLGMHTVKTETTKDSTCI